jgi:hypothetical protein
VVDAEALGGGSAEHADRLGRGRGVEEAAVGDRGADRTGKVEAGGVDAERVGVDRGDQRAAVGVGTPDRAGVGDVVDGADAADHAGRVERERDRLAAEVLTGADGEEVGAELVDLVEQAGLGGGGEPEHGHDRGDPDRDAEGRESGA